MHLLVDASQALIRLSMAVVLPTDDEIEAGGAIDAGQYLIALHQAGLLSSFLEGRRQDFWIEPRQKVRVPPQPACVLREERNRA